MMARGVLVAGGLAVVATFFLIGARGAHTPQEANPRLRVVRRLDRPLNAGSTAADPAQLAASARHRWTGREIDAIWQRASSAGSTTSRSPRLDLPSPDDLHTVVVSFDKSAFNNIAPNTGTPGRRGVLLWSDRPTLTREEYLRNRRDLVPPPDGTGTISIAGRDLRGDGGQVVRHLFLHTDVGGAAAAGIASLAIVTPAELSSARESGPMRLLEQGESRTVIQTRAPSLDFRTDIPAGAELLFGVRLPPAETTARLRVSVASRGRESVALDTVVVAGRWEDLRARLPEARNAGISLRLESVAPGTLVSWSVPLLLVPDERAHESHAAPNIVLYVVDTLRADRVGVYGAATGNTPAIDRLGGGGLVFEHAYAAASWTKPSVASLMTSLYPATHRLGARYYADPMPAGVVTLQSILSGQGYVTKQFAANGLAGTLSNLDAGFDSALMPEALQHLAVDGTPRKISAADINARVLPWIDAHARDRFFIAIQSIDPHPPFAKAPSGSRAAPTIEYDAAIALNDNEIGRLHDRLTSLGLADRTLVIITADHGEAFGEHGKRGHGQSVYDEETRVPLILHWPGTIAPGRVDTPVSLVDVVPTALDYAGLSFDPAEFQGSSLRPRSGAPARARAPVFVTRFVYPDDVDSDLDRHDADAIVAWPWKLIATDTGRGRRRLELYDLSTDPAERHDRAAADPARVASIEKLLAQHQQRQRVARNRFVLAFLAPGTDGRGGGPPRLLPSKHALEQLRTLGYIR